MSEPLYCINHPNRETFLRCNRCGVPICPKCAVRTEVGYRCRACINRQQQVYYAEFRPVYYLVAALVALPLSIVAGFLIPALGWFALLLGPAVGLGIAEAAHWAIGQRRGRHTWLVVCGAIVAGASLRLLGSLLALFFSLQWAGDWAAAPYLFGGVTGLVWNVVYIVGAVGTAYARLRSGRRQQ
ncbi:MAG: hypothetical protein JW900_09585 [Anaerolineae bacterium]|nr:hypothetical protein [Anaerolineae bacterium]